MRTDVPAIVIAEDNPNDVDLTLEALDQHNLANRVIVAHDGVEAMQSLRREGAFSERAPGDPGVVLLDIKMPRKDGLEVLREIHGDPALKRIPVVILTSSREEQDLITSYDLGVNAYVVKPVALFKQGADDIVLKGRLALHVTTAIRGTRPIRPAGR